MEKAIPWQLKINKDERGSLVAIESNRGVPFPIQRIFYVYGIPDYVQRGGHAHKDNQQVLICLNGACRVIANGDEHYLSAPDQALYVPPGIYLELDNWQPDSVLLVLCSHHYDEEDYLDTVC